MKRKFVGKKPNNLEQRLYMHDIDCQQAAVWEAGYRNTDTAYGHNMTQNMKQWT